MNPAPLDLTSVLYAPQRVLELDPAGWDRMIRQARSADLLARLAHVLRDNGIWEEIPARPRLHLHSAQAAAEAHARSVCWEVGCIREALQDLRIPIILLKGAAYVMADLPAGRGRFFYDVDIMVPRESLEAVERKLLIYGWVPSHRDAYDQRYYRQWMHELPPFQHVKRQSILDVHHSILPQTARLHPDPEQLRTAAVRVEGYADVRVLCPEDMVLHSATHLFHDGELEHGLRDLVDLDLLLRHFSDSAFWDRLVPRAERLELLRPLFYALRYATRLLATPVPAHVIEAAAAGRPANALRGVMDQLFTKGLMPHHPMSDAAFTGLARWTLYVRSHYLRMPPHLLLPHLARKAVRRHVRNEA